MDLGPRYELRRELGSGGLGRVYLVHDRELDLDLALKVLEAKGSSADLDRFHAEFALLARIEHPRIARAHDFGWIDGRPYFTCDYVAGRPLSESSEARDPGDVLSLARDLADALAFLHRGSIVHLDVKPSNVIVPETPSPGRPRAVLIDFGLFRQGPVAATIDRLRGSLPYMAPEHFDGGELGPWTDVYALGVTLYWLLTGAHPRPGAAALAAQGSGREVWEPLPPPPTSFEPSIPPALENVVLRCLAVSPRSRYPDAGAVGEDLEAAHGVAHRPAPHALPRETVGRGRELAMIDAFLDGLAGRTGAPVLLLTGPAGLGQTRLIEEARLRSQRRSIHFLLAKGRPGAVEAPGSLFSGLPAFLSTRDGARPRWEGFLALLRRPRASHRPGTEGERRARWAGELALAVRSLETPLVLAVDGLQWFDEVSVELLFLLARQLCEAPAPDAPPLRLLAGFREEGTCEEVLRNLAEYLLEPRRADVITLRQLEIRDALALIQEPGVAGLERRKTLEVVRRAGGSPAEILRLTRNAAALPAAAELAKGSTDRTRPASRDGEELLASLALLRRPAEPREAARLAGLSGRRASRAATALVERGLLRVAEAPGAAPRWAVEPEGMLWLEEMPDADRRARARRVGSMLCRAARGLEDSRLVEGARCLLASGDRGLIAVHGPRAARALLATLQGRAAGEILRAVLEALPRSQRLARAEIALELSGVEARLGRLQEGIRLLRKALEGTRGPDRGLRPRLVLALAGLYARRGDFRRADALFLETLEGGEASRRIQPLDRLRFLNEHAAVKVVLGEHAECLRLCEEGLRLARRRRGREAREILVHLLSTRAGVALRGLRPLEATRDLEQAVEIADAIGSRVNQAVLLNNLGIAYANADRYPEALRAYSDAEEIGLQVDEGPSLASVHMNRAVVHAKLGQFEAADRALECAARLNPAVMGPRQRDFYHHSRGLCSLQRGRFHDARLAFDEALAGAAEAQDPLLGLFDRLHRAECLLFEGLYEPADRELAALAAADAPAAIRRQALARRALLRALIGEPDAARELAAMEQTEARASPLPRSIEAWSTLLIGWSASISASGCASGDGAAIADAHSFFARRGLTPAASLASWVQAERRFLGGDLEGAEAALRGAEPPRGELAGALWPLLRARLLLGGAPSRSRAVEAADVLAEAGSRLAGNPLPEWAARLEALRARLLGDPDRLRRAEEARESLHAGLIDPDRAVASPHWSAWTETPAASASPSTRDAAAGPAEPETTMDFGGASAPDPRLPLVARSVPMRRLLERLDRIRGSDLPVLIEGETGSGKELLARIIHAESTRAGGPFVVLDCAALPAALADAELFGARAGAFTGLDSDRAGLLAAAASGSVLLDEVASLTLETQAKLLRVLGERTYRPLGSEESRSLEARLLFATSRDLDAEASAGRLRADLLHRIRVLGLAAPPLRDRAEDVEDLARRFIAESRSPPPSLSPEAAALLRGHHWPGNVRELRNLIARLALEHTRSIEAPAVRRALDQAPAAPRLPDRLLEAASLDAAKDVLEREYILHHLERLGGDTRALSRLLGVSRQQLYRRLRRLGMRLRDL